MRGLDQNPRPATLRLTARATHRDRLFPRTRPPQLCASGSGQRRRHQRGRCPPDPTPLRAQRPRRSRRIITYRQPRWQLPRADSPRPQLQGPCPAGVHAGKGSVSNAALVLLHTGLASNAAWAPARPPLRLRTRTRCAAPSTSVHKNSLEYDRPVQATAVCSSLHAQSPKCRTRRRTQS